MVDGSDELFTPDEQAEIARRIDEVRQLVQEKAELNDRQLAAIDQRLDHAEEASKRLGRKDWLVLLYGSVVSTTVTDAVPSGVIQTVVTTVLHGINVCIQHRGGGLKQLLSRLAMLRARHRAPSF